MNEKHNVNAFWQLPLPAVMFYDMNEVVYSLVNMICCPNGCDPVSLAQIYFCNKGLPVNAAYRSMLGSKNLRKIEVLKFWNFEN